MDEEPFVWQRHALCRSCPELFFPTRENVTTDKARGVCRACLVRAPCLAYALRIDASHGIWGGLTVQQRRRLVRVRAGLEPDDDPVVGGWGDTD